MSKIAIRIFNNPNIVHSFPTNTRAERQREMGKAKNKVKRKSEHVCGDRGDTVHVKDENKHNTTQRGQEEEEEEEES